MPRAVSPRPFTPRSAARPPAVEALEPRLLLDAASPLPVGEDPPVGALQTITMDPSEQYQTMDGIGACAYAFPFANGMEYNSAAVKVAFEELDLHYIRLAPWLSWWETNNDNSDPFSINWSAFGVPNDFASWWEVPTGQYFTGLGIETSFGVWGLGDWVDEGDPADYDEIAELLTTYAMRMENGGVPQPYMELKNEPGLSDYQNAEALRDAALRLLNMLDFHGMDDVMLRGPEYHRPRDTAAWADVWLANETLRDRTNALSYHTWWDQSRTYYDEILQVAEQYDKPVWATEVGLWATSLEPETWNTAFDYATSQYRAIAWSRAERTYQWTVAGHDGAIGKNGERYPAFYSLKHYANYIPPGATLIDTTVSDPDLLTTAFALPDGNYSVVVLNDTYSADTLELSLPGVALRAVEGETSREGSYGVSTGVIDPNPGGAVELSLPARSITSLILEPVATTPGDFNYDGEVDAGDIDLLFAEIAGGTHNPLYDLTGDDLVDDTDADELVHGILGTEYGDATLDGAIDAADLSLVAANWQLCGRGWAGGDFNGDRCVNAADLSLLAANWMFPAAGAGQLDAPLSEDPVGATVYYVSADGDDGGAGTTELDPLATVAEAIGRASAGDTILLQRGDVFRESPGSISGITIDAYGEAEDDLPVLSGSMVISDWSQHEGDIYVADVSQDIGYLFVDGEQMTIARYPNEGWLRTISWTENSDGTNTVLMGTGLAGREADHWVGANIRWRRWSWWFETREVTAYDPVVGSITLDGKSMSTKDSKMEGWGFYMDNLLDELDVEGEYYHDADAGKLYLYAPDGADPNGLLVEASVRGTGLGVTGDSLVRNVAFRHYQDWAVNVSGGSPTVEYNLFEGNGRDGDTIDNSGGTALRATWSASSAHVHHNVFRGNLNTAISWNQQPYNGGSSVIEYNEIIDTGVVDGYGGSGPWHAAGVIVSNASDLHFQYNRIDGTGYAGIIIGKPDNFVEYNVITNAMSTLNDGAGVYTNCDRTTIRHNIILNTEGGMQSSAPWANISHGIWPEFLNQYRESVIEYNTVAHSGGRGLFLDDNFDCEIRGNIFFDNAFAQILLAGRTDPSQGHVFEDNILYANTATQQSLSFEPGYDYGSWDNNYLGNPYTETHIGRRQNWSTDLLTIDQWQAQYTWADDNARTDYEKLDFPPTSENPLGRADLFINDTETVMQVDLPGVYRDLDGTVVEGSIELQPYSSALLVLVGNHPGDFNYDGETDAADIDLLADEINAGTHRELYDLTGDGLVDHADMDEMVHGVLNTEYGDANLDGRVDAADLSLLAAHWMHCPNTWAKGDFTGSGCVGSADLSLLAAHWLWQRPTEAGDPSGGQTDSAIAEAPALEALAAPLAN